MIKANFKSAIVLSENNDIYYWGKTYFEKKIIKKPKKFVFN